eukprot:jgi/Chrzof1/8089/UNPLg00134.t1
MEPNYAASSDTTVPRVCLLWGMSGLGKSVLARDLYNLAMLSWHYGGGTCYVEITQEAVILDKQHEIAKKLLGEHVTFASIHDGHPHMATCLSKIHTLLILDDVWTEQLEDLIGNGFQSTLATVPSSSRVIIVSQVGHLLQCVDANVCPLEDLEPMEQKELFCLHAFKDRACPIEYDKLVEKLVPATGGLPVALKVIGAALYLQNLKTWYCALAKLEEGDLPFATDWRTAVTKLKIGYELLALPEQRAFVDVAMWFHAKEWDLAEVLLGPDTLGCLEERALIDRQSVHGFVDNPVKHPPAWETLTNLRVLDVEAESLDLFTCSALTSVQCIRCKIGAGANSPVSWSTLTELHGLYLNDSNLTGMLPGEWSALKKLQWLDLANNRLQEQLPLEWSALSNLQTLYLYDNQLMGQLPVEWSALTNLQRLELQLNKFKGQLPVEWSALHNLRSCFLDSNQLAGQLPVEWLALSNLHWLALHTNQLEGQLPVEWSALSNLHWLFLNTNQLQGQLPVQWSALSNLQQLSLNNNQLGGQLPVAWSALSNLVRLFLSNNQLNGQLPVEWSALSNLQQLVLHHNQLEGQLPVEWLALSNLQLLDLGINQLEGQLPVEWSALSNLQQLDLDINQLVGQLPVEWSTLSNLQQLGLHTNQLEGQLPVEWSALSSLQKLFLDSNQLAGQLPVEWSALSNLHWLALHTNQLEGQLPLDGQPSATCTGFS